MDEDSKNISKVSGYLEKKGKMKMMSSYKKYWFVLEGRLLLYYRSKDEYEDISPFKGSINLGPPCNVKPCPSQTGVFQIETRATTITLRAQNRDDQNRWMQGIMSALNQNKKATRLSHFRYSLDEIPQYTVDSIDDRPNIIPQSTNSPKNQSNKIIIQRLQKIGAHSYGGSIGTIHQIANTRKGENLYPSNSEESLQFSIVDLNTFRNSLLIDNDQYGVLKRSNVPENVELRNKMRTEENIYERISFHSTMQTNHEVNYSVPKKVEKAVLQKTQSAPCDNYNVGSKENLSRPSTLLVENETYQRPQDLREPDNKIRQTSFVLENDHYYSVDKIIRFPNTDSEVIYSEPKCTELIDHNENNLVLSRINDEENAYSVIKMCDPERNSGGEYEDLEQFKVYTPPKRQSEEDIYEIPPSGKNKAKTKLKKEKKGKHVKQTPDNDKKEMKLKKTSSFIRRVWKMKSKYKEKDKTTEEEALYETVPPVVVEKVAITDGSAVQMLSELHNILEHKKPMLIELITGNQAKSGSSKTETDESKLASPKTPTSPIDDSTAVQMLSELQNILENKKHMLHELRHSNESPSKNTPPDITHSGKSQAESVNEKKITNADVDAASSSGSDESPPQVPPKQRAEPFSPYHDYPRNNQPINRLPPKKKHSLEPIKTIDEILNDLDKSEDSNKNKVKKLIKQFSGSDFNENDVVLRTKRSSYCVRDDSDELSRLLNELSKVTCAPILTPGVTSSLISTTLTDKELINLLPGRRRRYSDPDYDIPRPHKSLINLPKKEDSPDNVIGSTRFFGPILKPSDIDIQTTSSEDIPQSLSITPDSLEPEIYETKSARRLSDEEKSSYTSHNYIQLKNCTPSNRNGDGPIKRKSTHFENSIKCFDSIIIENDVYAQPKSLHNFNSARDYKDTAKQLYYRTDKNLDLEAEDDKSHDVFVDSLEICDKSPAY